MALGLSTPLLVNGQVNSRTTTDREEREPTRSSAIGENDLNQRDSLNQTASYQGAPKKFNKASELVGMEVKNQDGEDLGEIKEIVLDLNGGRVAYAVLECDGEGVGGLLNIDNKLIAVPIAAFKTPMNEEEHYLTLHADMEKFSKATGFNEDNWPAIGRPMWGAEPFWETPATPTTDRTRQLNQPINRSTIDRETDANRQLNQPVNRPIQDTDKDSTDSDDDN
jgi:sporulation protein YlmC with PRC-barrel domain